MEYLDELQKSHSDQFEKIDDLWKGGKLAQIGEVRTWDGKKYQKVHMGWKPVGESKGSKIENVLSLEDKIAEIKAGRTLVQLKKEDIKSYYKVKGLSSKLSDKKAEESGNFITKSDLTEYKGLIIWLMKNKTNYKGYLNLKDAMITLLNRIENEKITFKTKRGIKGIVSGLAINVGLENVEANLRADHGFTVLDHTYGNPILEDFTQHRISVLMNTT